MTAVELTSNIVISIYYTVAILNNTRVCVLHLVTTAVDHCEVIIIGNAHVPASLQHKQTVAISMNLCI